ncbi:DMT family transporter [bacterium LRH843]|nr:DMT family transporter [bacterium LRH843]
MEKFSFKNSLAIACLVLIWGVSWSINKMALPYTPPLLFAGLRTLLGGAILAILFLPSWKLIKWRDNWFRYCVSALFNVVLFFGLQTVGLNYLPGGLFSVLVYFQPVLIGLFAWMWLGEKMTILKVVGLVLGFLGIVAISADGFTGEISIVGVCLALLCAIGWALGVIYVKKQSNKVDPLWMIALQLLIGGSFLLSLGTGLESWSNIVWSGPYFIGLGFGATLGIPIAFIIYFKLVNSGDASKVASFTFLVPLIAVLIGSIFMNEPITLSLLGGLILIVSSICFVNYRGKVKEQQLKKENVS